MTCSMGAVSCARHARMPTATIMVIDFRSREADAWHEAMAAR